MKKKRKAFTLIELIIVIAILGILVAIAIPKYNKSRIQAAVTAHKANVEMLKSAARMKILEEDIPFAWINPENDKIEESLKSKIYEIVKNKTIKIEKKEDWEKYVEKWPNVPNGLNEKEKDYTLIYDGKDINVYPNESIIKK